MTRRVLVLAMVALAAIPAYAEDIVAYQTEGDAPAGGADARVMALDEAFANAASNALGELVGGDVRGSRKGELDREIVARARLWVSKFSVTRDETTDGRRQLTVSVKIDRDKMRARLTELNIPMKAAPIAPPPQGDPQPGPQARTATILLRLTLPKGVRADYGQNADVNVPGLSALTTVLRNAGFAVRRAPAAGPAARADGELPLADDEADALANEAKAETVAIAGVSVGPNTVVRGLPGTAAMVTAHVRLYDRTTRKAVQASSSAAARGDDPGYAIDRALLAATTDVLPPPPTKLAQAGAFRGEDAPVAEAGIVLVRLPSRTPFSMVLAEQRYLAGAKGIRAATLRRLSPSGWVIGVATSESIEQVARIAKKAPSSDTSAVVKIVGNIVEVALGGAP